MPMPALSDFLFKDFIGKRPDVIKNVQFGTNPSRLSYKGKEILLTRYNYLEQLKKNHLSEELEAIYPKEAERQSEDTLKVARTIYYQQNLVPLTPVTQPVIWAYESALQAIQPDFLILADECKQYSYTFGRKAADNDQEENVSENTTTVLNPGNFGRDRTFSVLYPVTGEVQLSKI